MADDTTFAAAALSLATAITESTETDRAPSGASESPPGESGRSLPPALRKRFVALRKALIERGINDPVLSRFDSYTVAQPSAKEIAEQLKRLANQLAT